MSEPAEDNPVERSADDILSIRQALATLPLPVSEREFRLGARRLGLNLLSGSSMMLKRGEATSRPFSRKSKSCGGRRPARGPTCP